MRPRVFRLWQSVDEKPWVVMNFSHDTPEHKWISRCFDTWTQAIEYAHWLCAVDALNPQMKWNIFDHDGETVWVK
jgi:hypothetical protein